MITRREFSKLGLGLATFSTGVHTAFGVYNDTSSSNIILPDEWTGGRRVGIRTNGAYWGGGNEQIDMLSGNLNFSLPLILSISRGTFARVICSYNSQLWERSGSKEHNYSVDTGFGCGWSVRIGSIIKQSSGNRVSGYTYINETGAEYPLSLSRGVWISLQGLYVYYDHAKMRLQFPNGTFWVMGCESAVEEPDAGALYPTLIQDRNGNQIIIRYMNGAGSDKEDSSSRIMEIIDARAMDTASGRKTYSFIYDAGKIPHLMAITNHIGNSENWAFSYEKQSLVSPFNSSGYGLVSVLRSVRTTGSNHTFSYNASGELKYAHLPYGARFRWEYETTNLTAGSGIRCVKERGLMLSPDAKEDVFDIRRSKNTETAYTVLTEPDNAAKRIWTFNPDGLLNTIDERTGNANRSLRRTTHRWKSTESGVPYIGVTTVALDAETSDEKSSREEFDRDLFGNLTESRKFDYDNPSKPISVTRNTYLTDPAYIDLGIYNLLLAKTVSNGEETVEQIRNQYDTTPLFDKRSLSEHDPEYNAAWTVRGNLTESIIGEVYMRNQFDITGSMNSQEDGVGTQTSFIFSNERNNNGIVQTIPNQNAALGTRTILNADLKPIFIILPGGGKIENSFNNGLLMSTTTADGGTRSYTYEGNAVIEIAGRKYKKSVYDDFHRLCIVEEGATDDDGTISIVEYEYGAVPGSPLGACLRASIPHAPGANPAWISYEYDALGRFTATNKAGHGGRETYAYKGNDTTVTNARGGWKTFTHDAKWQLHKVATPDTNGSGENETLYQYNALGKLKNARLLRPEGTQEHTFRQDGGGRLIAGNRAESGREDLSYNADGSMASRTDAKGQRTAYSYDSHKRLVSVKRFGSNGQVKPEECVSYYYDRNPFDADFSHNADGRLTAAQWGDTQTGPGLITEMYSYTPAGRMTQKRMRVNRGHSNTDLDLGYSYDKEGRITAISYPNGGPTLNYSYDALGRPNLLTTATDVLVKDVSYSAQGHLTSFSQLIPETDEYLIETHEISSSCHTNSVTAKTESSSLPLVNIEYNYYEDGKLESDIDRVSGEETRYEYDAVGRLTAAKSQNRNWELGYEYDGFGNLSGHKRKNKGGKGKDFEIKHNPATNRMETDSVEYDANGNIISLAGMKLTFDIENRLVELNHVEKGAEQYAYDTTNRRIWKKQPDGIEEYYMYGEDGRLLAVYQMTEGSKGAPELTLSDYSIYFAKRLIRSRDKAVVLNRQYSVEAEVGRNSTQKTSFLPFGEEEYATAENRTKYGTYRRDATSGLDYAKQRYYSSELGRFISPDPYIKSIQLNNPETWNRYAYCGNDPVNHIDPNGTCQCMVDYIPCNIYACPHNWWHEYVIEYGGNSGGWCPTERYGYWVEGETIIVDGGGGGNGAPPAVGTYEWAMAIIAQLDLMGPGIKSMIIGFVAGMGVGFAIEWIVATLCLGYGVGSALQLLWGIIWNWVIN